MTRQQQIDALKKDWAENPRWDGVERPYSAEEVVALRGSLQVEHTLARNGAAKLWAGLTSGADSEAVCGLGAVTGNQAVQEVQAGLKAIYCSGWQVAADGNTAGAMYPDQSLYPVDSVPNMITRINNSLMRTDQIHWLKGDTEIDWMVPVVADAEAGFGGNLNAFELTRHMIIAGAAAVHFEDQLSSAKKCGHLGGKVLVPTGEAINKLVAARLAADVAGVPTLIIARTDADAATLITSDIDERDRPFVLQQERTHEGFYHVKNGMEACIARGKAYAPYADLLWMETSRPNLGQARTFSEGVRKDHPSQLLAYNCSPSFNWRENLDEATMRIFREELARLHYKFQFITLAGWHALNNSMFELASDYVRDGMLGYSQMQNREFDNAEHGYRADKHQSFVGTTYFDAIQNTIQQGKSSTVAMTDSTETAQFH